MKEKPIKVGISIGDMNGIGLEIILKTFEDHQILELCTPIIFASNKLVSFQKKPKKVANMPFYHYKLRWKR